MPLILDSFRNAVAALRAVQSKSEDAVLMAALDEVTRDYLRVLADHGVDPVRLNVLASKLDGLSKTTVERKIEPDLVWLGLIEKNADGRRLMAAGREHLQQRSKP